MAKRLTANSIHDNGSSFRVYLALGYTELYIDIDKETGSSVNATIHPQSPLGNECKAAAHLALKKTYGNTFKW